MKANVSFTSFGSMHIQIYAETAEDAGRLVWLGLNSDANTRRVANFDCRQGGCVSASIFLHSVSSKLLLTSSVTPARLDNK